MIGWICAGAAFGALAAHEWIARHRPAAVARRRFVLAFALASSVAWAVVAAPRERLRNWWNRTASEQPGPPFKRVGDPLLAKIAVAEEPSLRFPSPAAPDAIRSWQNEARVRLSRLVAVSPAPEPPKFEVTQETAQGDRVRRFGSFLASDGTRIPGFLFLRAGQRPGPAVLVIPGHGVGIAGTAGLVKDYQHASAARLAEAGFVVFTMELRGFGYLGNPSGSHHRVAASNALAAGSSYKAFVLDDLRRALGVLRSLAETDPSRIGVVGASLGGELATQLGALDPSIRAVCAHAYGGPLGPLPGVLPRGRDGEVALPHGCHVIPGSNRVLEREDWFRLIGPRPLQVRRGADESRSLLGLEQAVRAAYAPLDALADLDFGVSPGGHEFFVADAIEFLIPRL